MSSFVIMPIYVRWLRVFGRVLSGKPFHLLCVSLPECHALSSPVLPCPFLALAHTPERSNHMLKDSVETAENGVCDDVETLPPKPAGCI